MTGSPASEVSPGLSLVPCPLGWLQPQREAQAAGCQEPGWSLVLTKAKEGTISR